jgi:SAM-dependent MidA family methyltransferase
MDRSGTYTAGVVQANLRELICHEIAAADIEAIPFARFMELALYHPKWGYYQQACPKLGKQGDFFTNSHVGSIYGRVLAQYVGKLVQEIGEQVPWTMVEMGAGEGRLLEQLIVGLMEQELDLSPFYFYIVDISSYHRQVQQQRLAHLPVCWRCVNEIEEISPSPYSFVYSNEWIDALPVHRIKREGGEMRESYVAKHPDSDQLVEQWRTLSTDELEETIEELGYSLQEGQTAEMNLHAKKWMKKLAAWMESGLMLTIDYGGKTADLLQRWDGTLRGYRQHQQIMTILAHPGYTDLTSHVNFEALMRWGETFGLQSYFYQTQAQFLLQAGILNLYPLKRGSDPFCQEVREQRAIQQLIHPQAMGEAFQVLLQGKGVEMPCL